MGMNKINNYQMGDSMHATVLGKAIKLRQYGNRNEHKIK